MAKKRANGEGNIRKRKDGRWEARYTAGHDPKTGKRIIKNVLGKTQAEVREKLKRALEETNGMDVARADDFTVATWLKTWYDLYAKPNVRVATADRYDLMINTYTIPRIGNIKLTKLTSRDLQKLYKDLMEKGRERKTKTGAQGLTVPRCGAFISCSTAPLSGLSKNDSFPVIQRMIVSPPRFVNSR